MSRSWSSVALITGMPRSGTSAMATALSAPDVAYLHEPLNPLLGMQGGPDEFLVPHLDAPVHHDVVRAISLSYRPRGPRFGGTPGTRAATSYVRTRLSHAKHLVLKDPTQPFLLMASGAALGLPVVVMVRHPEAVLASYRRLGISPLYGLRRMRDQGELLRSWGIELDDAPASDAGAVGVLWRAISEMADHPAIEALVVRHEDLVADPKRVAACVSKHTGLAVDISQIETGRASKWSSAWSSVRRQSLRGVNPDVDKITEVDRGHLAEALHDVQDRRYGADV